MFRLFDVRLFDCSTFRFSMFDVRLFDFPDFGNRAGTFDSPDGVYELRRHTRDDDDDDDVASAGATGGDGGGESRGARARCVRADRASDRARDANVRERGGGQ
jgi:hypothetical protein